jgi:hypothetical protein
VFIEEAASVRKRHRPDVAVEQLSAHFQLQLLYLPAERRLGHVQALGGAAEISLNRDGEEIA